MSSLRNNRLLILGVAVSLVIAYVSEISIAHQAALQKIVWMLLAVVGIMCIFLYRKRALYGKCFLILNLAYVPYILAILYTVVLSMFVGNEYGQVSQAITTSMFIVVDMLAVSALISVFKSRAATVVFWGIVLSYALSILLAIRKVGLAVCINYYVSGDFLGYNANNVLFEKHDVGVAVIPFMIYYLYLIFSGSAKYEKYMPAKLIVLAIIMFMCGKRVAMLAIFIGVIMVLLFAKNMAGRSRIAFVFLNLAFVFCFVYVAMIKTGVFTSIVNMLGINSMARTDVYDWFADWYTLSPLYAGYGFQYVHRYMEAGGASTLVNAFSYMHNSILQIYIEMGFIGFFVWYGYTILIYPMVTKKLFGSKAFLFFVALLMPYVFMLMVDNVMTYPLYQLSMYTVFAQFLLNSEDEKMREEI